MQMATESDSPLHNSSREMDWGIRLIALLIAVTSISLGYAWVDQFYRGIAVNSILSFPALDYPWMPVHTAPVAIIGNHYFGDFQLPYAWALNVRDSLSPYLSSAIPANYPPLAIIILIPFTVFPIKVATAIFLALSAVVFVLPLWLMLSPLRPALRCLILVPISLMSSPFISMLDRGNDIGIGLALIAWTLWSWRSGRWVWCGVFLTTAIAVKAYPVALLIVPLALRRYRFTVIVLSAAIFLNFAALLLIPGGFTRNLRVVLPSMTSQQLTTGTQLTSWSMYSLLPKLSGMLLGPAHISQFLHPNRFVLWLPSVLYLIVVFTIIRQRRVPQWCWGGLSLASIQLVVPISGVYTTGWACLAAIWFIQGSFIQSGRSLDNGRADLEENMALRILFMLAIVASLVPSVFSIPGAGGFGVVATRLLSPALILLTVCLAFVKSFQRKDSNAIQVFTAE